MFKKGNVSTLHGKSLDPLTKIARRLPGVVFQFHMRPDGGFCVPYASEAAHEIFRIRPEELVDDARKLFSIVHPEDLKPFIQSILHSADSITPWTHEFRIVFDDGVQRWLAANSNPERSADGSVIWDGFVTDVTARKASEKALKKNEQRRKAVVDSGDVGIWEYDLISNEIACDDTMLALHRVAREEFKGTREAWLSNIHPADRARIETSIHLAITGFEEFSPEFRVLLPNGDVRNIKGTSHVIRDGHGRAIRIIGTCWDNRAQENAREEFQHFNSAVNMIHAAFFLIRENADIAYANDHACEALGFKRSELVGKTISLFDDNFDTASWPHRWELAKSKSYLRSSTQHRRKDGSKFPVEITSRHVLIGHREYIFSFAQDITERNRLQNDTVTNLARYQALMATAIDGVSIIDTRGNLRDANEAFYSMLGYRREESIGLNVCDWDVKTPREELLTRLATGERRSYRLYSVHRRKDGTLIDVEISNTRIDLDGERLIFSSTRDITERKRTEADLRIAATAFDSQESLMITDPNGVILRVNKAFSACTGYSQEEIIGKTTQVLKSGRHDRDFYLSMWNSLNRTGSWQGEIWDKRKDGTIYPKWLTISAVRGSDGSITNYVGSHIDITDRKASEDRIQNLAFYDSLTGLPNRQLLMDRLRQALSSSARNGQEGALLFVDIDNFKTLNDAMGHQYGDLFLQQAAVRLSTYMRDGDTVARLGGDEFVLILQELGEDGIEAAAITESVGENLLSILAKPYRLEDHEYQCTASMGATMFGRRRQSMDELLKQADIAMYQAKKCGRNLLRFFDQEMQDAVTARAALERQLREAIEKKSFTLHYQAQVDRAGCVLGAEALIRWNSSEDEVRSPNEFIPLAEETGLILPIGQWLLNAACAQLKAWEENAGTAGLVLSINISARQFHNSEFVSQVQAAVQLHGINPNQLNLEITESILLDNTDDTISAMRALKSIGVRFSLDDFGTGYSSLQYLKRLPLDQLKIDKSFVRDLPIDANDRAIVQTILAIATSLRIETIAEGVETEDQHRLLVECGCIYFQGYLFGKPVPIEQFEALLAESAATAPPSKRVGASGLSDAF